MSTGRILILIGCAMFTILFLVDLFIAIYQYDEYVKHEEKLYARRELKKFVKEWHEENERKERKGSRK